MSPACPGGQGTSACHCLPAGRLYFLRPGPALAFFLMTRGTQLDSCCSRNNSHLQVGGAGAPHHPPGPLHLGRAIKGDLCLVVFKLGSSKPWDSVGAPQGPLRVYTGEERGTTKQMGFSRHPLHSSKQPFISGLQIGFSYKINFRKKKILQLKESLKNLDLL